jgi:uncharacterized protein
MKGFRRAHSTVFWLLLAAFSVFPALTMRGQKVDQLPKPTDYISDFAHVLSPQTVAALDRVCTQLDHSQANAQIAVVIVQTLDGEDAADYSNELETKWKMGRKGSDRGVLILLAVGDHKRRIEVGYGLEGILPDGKLGDIGRAMVPDLRANDFDGAASLAVGQIAQTIAADAKVTLDQDPNQDPALAARPMRQAHHASAGQVLLVIILIIFFGGFFVLRLLMSFGMLLGGWGRGPWIGGGGFGGGGFGGGGFGGGGGGDSGFGGFGGGDFGGGGAGGSW